MDFRLAQTQDLPQIKQTFQEIIRQMEQNNLQIWDDIYPCSFFEDDIKNNRLYVLTQNKSTELLSVFALCDTDEGAGTMAWNEQTAAARYLDRFGVNAHYSRKGIGSIMLQKAKETAKAFGAEYLRLFVVDENLPAIRLYEKGGFTKVNGIYQIELDEENMLNAYGYEIKL